MTPETHSPETTVRTEIVLKSPQTGLYLGSDTEKINEVKKHFESIILETRKHCTALGIRVHGEFAYTGSIVVEGTQELTEQLKTILSQEDLIRQPLTLPPQSV